MKHRIAVLEGDGVGPEVVTEAVKVLKASAARFGFELEFQDAPVGRGAYRKFGHSCPADTVALCRQSDAILFGAVGGPDDEPPPPMGNGIVYLRRELNISCNFRPIKLYRPLIDVGPIKKEVKMNGVDFVIVPAFLQNLGGQPGQGMR